jgi:pimeloyl-ACP methyl ester carboxylesterase
MTKLRKSLAFTSGAIALLGIGLATRNNLFAKKTKEDFPRLGKYCNVQGCSIHYFTEGNGSPVIFIHGEQGDIYDFYLSPIWAKLKKDFQVTAIDRPGYGYSTRAEWKDYGFRNQAEIIDQTIKLLNINKPILIGFGEGCGIILAMLMEHQDRYSGAILIDEKLPEKIELNDKIINAPLVGKLLLWTLSPVIAQKKANDKLKESELPRENIKKATSFDVLPNNILSNSQNKEFMKIDELKNLSEICDKIHIPVTFIKRKDTVDEEIELINQLNLEEMIDKLYIVSANDINSEHIPLTNSEKIISIINKILK